MKKYLVAVAVIAAVYVGLNRTNGPPQFAGPSGARTDAIATAFSERSTGTQVTGEGVVTRILSDDTDGSQHQRFILRLASGQTLLVAHNIDLAPRIASLKTGDTVAFNGVFEWNEKGGLVHWTHHDPGGRHEAGWLKHGGQTFQ